MWSAVITAMKQGISTSGDSTAEWYAVACRAVASGVASNVAPLRDLVGNQRGRGVRSGGQHVQERGPQQRRPQVRPTPAPARDKVYSHAATVLN